LFGIRSSARGLRLRKGGVGFLVCGTECSGSSVDYDSTEIPTIVEGST